MLLSLAEKKTAKEVWEAIKTLCQGADRVKKARIQMLKSEFEALSMRENKQVDDFQLRMNGLVINIRALGEEMDEQYVVKKLLRAVPSRFIQITSTMKQFGNIETMSVEEAIRSLKAHEVCVRGKSESNEGQLIHRKEEWKNEKMTRESCCLLEKNGSNVQIMKGHRVSEVEEDATKAKLGVIISRAMDTLMRNVGNPENHEKTSRKQKWPW